MKKKIAIILIVIAALVCSVILAGCEPQTQQKPEEATPMRISVADMKTEFEYDEAFSTGNLVVTVAMSDGSSYIATGDKYTVDSSAYNAKATGEYYISVKLNNTDLSVAYKVTVAEPDALEITLDGMKTEFEYGEAFSTGNLVVTVVLEDGSSYIADGGMYTVDSSTYNAKISGEYSVTVTLNDSDLSAQYKVTVNQPVATKITLAGMKKNFKWGEAFSTGSLTVTVTLSDDSTYTADSDTYTVDSSAYNANVAGEYSVIVTLNDSDLSEQYKVTVDRPVASEITLDGMKTEFEYGETFSIGDLVVTVTLEDGSTYNAENKQYKVDSSAYNAKAAGEYLIMIKLLNSTLSASYKVTVAPEPDVPWDQDGALKILTIGNSFSDDMMQWAWDIAASLGIKDVYLGNMYIGGCTLDTHVNNANNNSAAYAYRVKNSTADWKTTNNTTLKTAISAQDWDFISLQQASGSSGMPDTYNKLQQLIDYVKANVKDGAHPKLIWNMTWAYQQNSNHAEFGKYNKSQSEMYSKIVSTVNDKVLTNENIYTVIPCGTAIQNARTSFLGDTLTRDGYHLTYDMGRYTAGLTLIHKLTGLSLDKIAYAPSGIGDEYKAVAVESATNAVLKPFEVTKSKYETETLVDEEKYDLLDYTVTQGYYNSATDTYAAIYSTNGNSNQFYTTKRFTPEELPVGSIITIASGWQYRPEAWKNDAKQASRPDNVTTRKIIVTPEWWGDYKYRAFNIAKIGTPSIEGQADAAKAALKIYIPKADTETVYDELGYTKLDLTVSMGFYDSTFASNYSSIRTDAAGLSNKFYATKRFTPDELPVGSVITIASGWQYRPEAWKNDERQTSRPGNVTTSIIVITPEWWGDYKYRAFNIAKVGTPVIEGQGNAAKAAFKIYIPKQN